eukprot:3355736-Pyramimonas_sp.AAC.1
MARKTCVMESVYAQYALVLGAHRAGGSGQEDADEHQEELIPADQSDAGSMGIFSQWINQKQ